jgi:hypothetical protein
MRVDNKTKRKTLRSGRYSERRFRVIEENFLKEHNLR